MTFFPSRFCAHLIKDLAKGSVRCQQIYSSSAKTPIVQENTEHVYQDTIHFFKRLTSNEYLALREGKVTPQEISPWNPNNK